MAESVEILDQLLARRLVVPGEVAAHDLEQLVDRAELMISLMAMSVLDGEGGERLVN